MRKAGQVLRRVLDSYNISEISLAKGLGVEPLLMFDLSYEQTDPSAETETVVEIVKALHNINLSAAKDFLEFNSHNPIS